MNTKLTTLSLYEHICFSSFLVIVKLACEIVDFCLADKSVPANIGKIAGKLATGIVPSQAVHKEDKKYKVIPGKLHS